MADLQITAYLTPEKIPATTVDDQASDSSTIYLMPDSMAGKTLPMFVDLHLLEEGKNPIQCEFKPKVVVGHVWSPDPALPGSAAPYLATATLVKIDLPQAPFWASADFDPQLTSGNDAIGPTPATSPCPASDSDVLLIPKNGWELSCLPVPGEELIVTHHTHGHGSFSVFAYHTCPALTGGTIVAKWPHPTVDEAFVYDVEVEGSLFEGILPLDFEPYSVGDWCFLLRSIDAARDMTFPVFTSVSPKADETLRIVPITILGKG